MKAKLLDKNKVIKALEKSHQNMWFPLYSNTTPGIIDESIRIMIHDQTKEMVEASLTSFIVNFAMELQNCEPDKYPCALCHEEKE